MTHGFGLLSVELARICGAMVDVWLVEGDVRQAEAVRIALDARLVPLRHVRR